MKRILLLSLLLCCSLISVNANSGPVVEDGTAGSDVLIIDEDCPIEVSSEALTFIIHPDDSKVIATYTFINPQSHSVTSRLVFPLGTVHEVDINHCQITVNQEPISTQIRYTYKNDDEEFDEEKDLAKLYDSYKSDDFFSPELLVTHQIYSIDQVDFEQHHAAFAAFEIPSNYKDTIFYLNELNGISRNDETTKIGTFLNQKSELEIYLIGKPMNKLNWTVYRSGAMNELIDGTLTLVSSETMTFEDLAMKHYNPDSNFLKHDFYNATVDNLKELTRDFPAFDGNPDYPLIGTVMPWFDYEITIEPESSISNQITAPLIPTIHHNYNPEIYSYSYILSLAKHFKSFHHLTIEIETNNYLIKSNLTQDFNQTETGYYLSLDELPDSELTFDLCTVQNPKKGLNTSYHIISLLFLFIYRGIPILLIVLLILFFYKSKIQR